MNIFALDIDTKLAAQYHCDTHCSKMILETAQILCAVFHNVNLENSREIVKGIPYKATHLSHPCVKWAGASTANFWWLVSLGIELGKEFEYRRGKKHKSMGVIWGAAKKKKEGVVWLKITKAPDPFPQCVTEDLVLSKEELNKIWEDAYSKGQSDAYTKSLAIVEQYREYYRRDKKHLHKWTKREVPSWL